LHSIEEVKGSVRRGEDLKQYVEALRGKSATYKALKKELDDIAAENGVLVRTQHLLEHQLAAVAHGTAASFPDDVLPSNSDDDGSTSAELHEVIQRIRVMLAQQQQTQDEQSKLPENASSDGQDIMQSKRAWQKISELDMKLQENRAQVGPLSNQLKEARASLQDLEVQHTERQNHFSDMSLAYERKFANLESCVNASRKEIEGDNKQLHESTLQVERLETVLDQLTREAKDSAVSEDLQKRIQLQEEHLGNLHQKQQKLKETEHANKAQMSMMKDLLTFLAAKLALYSSEMRPPIYSTNSALENGEDNDQRLGR
jgi:chromosome segregation ATPase